MLGRIENLKLG